MPIGTCDPATRGDPYNVQTLEHGGGLVSVTVRYGWDLVSTKESPGGCDGPLVQGTGPASNRWCIRVVNSDTKSWWLHTKGRRGQPRDIQFPPGSISEYTVNQARNAGYETVSDIAELTLTTSPTAEATTRNGR